MIKSTSKRFPDFYIIGAPKCGTTSVYEFLRRHPGVFMPDLKEPQYFCSDLPSVRQVKSEMRYLNLFKGAKSWQVMGEASVWYLYSKIAVKEILQLNPNAKFIVMLRDPMKAVASLHNNSVMSLEEKHEDFEKAWVTQSDPPVIPALDYKGVFKFYDQLSRLFSVVPQKQIKVVILEKLNQDPQREYDAISDFLNLQRVSGVIHPHVNVARQWDSWLVRNYLLDPHPVVRLIMGIIKNVCNFFSIRPLMGLQWLFAREGKYKSYNSSFEQTLWREFECDVTRLKTKYSLPVDKFWFNGKIESKKSELDLN